MAFPSGTAYHADSDADDEYERSVMTSPTQLHTDSDASPTDSEPPSNENTPTTYGTPGQDQSLPRTIITEWTAEDSAQFIATIGLRQYCEAFLENEIVGEALIALKHDELKEMGIASVGHRLTILKNVYEMKVNQDIPMDPDHYLPLSAEQNPQYEMATKDDISRLARSIIKLRDDRIAQAEAQLTRLANDYSKLRLELLPIFKMAKERSEPLPYAPHATSNSPELYQQEVTSPPITQTAPEKGSLGIGRSISKRLGLTPKNNSPTNFPNTIHEGTTLIDSASLDPSAAASVASNQLTSSMSGGSLPGASPSNIPSPTSPMPYQSLPQRSYQGNPTTALGIGRYDGVDDVMRNTTPTPQIARDHDPPQSGKSVSSAKANPTNSTLSTASTMVQSGHTSIASTVNGSAGSAIAPTQSSNSEAPSVEIFKSFRVGLEDPCYKVLPAALRKYNIIADWRQYALYIVYGDQERCVGLEEKPLALFKDLDRDGKKPMFMLRRLTNSVAADSMMSGGTGVKPPGLGGGGGSGGVGGMASSAPSVRNMETAGRTLPGGVL